MTKLSKKITYCWMILVLSAFNKVNAQNILLPEGSAALEDAAQETIVNDRSAENTEVRAFHKPNRVLMKAAVVNYKSAMNFFNQNKLKPGMVTLKSGLQYRVIKSGSGAKPKQEDVISCRYQGNLINGTVFEQSPTGKPVDVKISSLIPGLKEAITSMPVGSKWEIFIPPELGFENNESSPNVGPAAVLIYTIDLVGIAKEYSNH